MANTVPIPAGHDPRHLTADERFLLSVIEGGSSSRAEQLERLENLFLRDVITSAEMLHIRRALEYGWKS